MILEFSIVRELSICIPRMSGDDPEARDEMLGDIEYSPHERG